MMQMIIYSPTGTEILDAPVTKEAIIKYVLMGDYYIELPFNLLEPTTFARGSYITYKGRKFEIMSTVRPEFDNKTGGYKYTLKFEAQQNHMKRFVCFWLGGDNPEAVFHNTTDLESFAALIVANMNKQLGGENWQVGTITVDNPKATKLVSFNGDKCWDILNTIAETFETEWWTEENGDLVSLCFGKLDFGSPEEFRQGNVVKNIPAKKGDDSSYGTRFYVFGSTRNLTSDYGQAPQGGETNHVSEIRLRLPDGQRYIDAIPGLSGSDIVEQVVFFDDIYPKNTETVTSIETVDRKNIEGQTDKAYVMYCKDTPFRPSDMIKGETLGATFTSGSLMGRDFELSINYKPETWKPEDGFDKKFEIIAQVESSGESQLIIPNESLHPEPGDTFVITGVKLPKERIEEAEKELLKAGESYAAKHSSDTDVYDCETNPVYCQENKKNYDAGQAVRLVDPRFGESGRLSRIQGYEKKLYNEYIATYTVGDNTAYSRIGNIESEVKANLYAQRIGVTESGASIYLITRYDSSAAADYNAYSDKRALWEFANKQFPDTFKGKMTFDDGAQFGGFASGMTGFGGIIDKKGNAEMQSLKLRGFLEVPELRYNRVEISMGDTWYAPSAGIIESVDTTAQTITLKLEEGEIGSPRVGDICMGIFHNLNTSENATADYDDGRGNRRFAGFATCYFRITEELDTATYKTFKYQLRPVSGAYPTQYHPAASMTFVGYGSFSNEDRQTSRYETRTYQRYLTGVSDWEFTASNIAAQYGDLSNLSIFGIEMRGYSAYLNNIYMSGVIQQFTPGGEEVPTIIDRGVWSATETYNRNDDVYWNNGHWRCLVDGTKTEPGKDAEEWVYLGGYGMLETVSIFKKSESEPAKPTELKIPPEGWTTETLPMSDQRPTWMCTGTVVDGEVKSWSAPQRVSGEPGNWTSYVFKNSDTEPAKPTSSDPIPSGWNDAPTGVGIWWMSKATIDASTGKAGAWSTPIRVTGEDGEPGPHTDFKYAKNNSTTTAPALVKTDRTPAGWSDTPPSLSSGEYLWMTQAEIDANNSLLHPTVGWATPVRISGEQGPKGDDGAPGEDGAPGKDGLQGCIIRLTEWASGVEYRNDLDLVSNGPRYIDIVTIYANNKQLKFQCSQTHTSSASNKPAAGSASAYWQQLNDMVPIYTPLLFAENAVINFLQGMEFVVHNSKTDISVNTIIAGLVGGDIPLFVGNSTPSNAPFRVAKDGSFVATKADITGTINASSGTIGNFTIDEGALKSTDSFGDMLLSSNLIRFTGSKTNLYLGVDTWPASTGGALYGPIRAEVSRSAAGGTAGNYGVYINVTGAALSDGTTTAARQSGNHALYIPEGFITGFRLRNVRTSSNRTLTDMDSVVFSTATREITLTLPSSPKQGQIYFIRKVGSGNVKLTRGNTQHRICTNSNSQNNTEITLDWGKLWIILWDHMNSMWTANWCQY
ncbi:MAG: hypothetical protein ACLT1W_00660 [Alistipes onderdonkii]